MNEWEPHARMRADLAAAEADDDVAFVFSERDCLALANLLPGPWWSAHGGSAAEALVDYVKELQMRAV